jgi:hypothetical protein
MRRRKPVYILTSLFIASFAIIGMLAFISKKGITKKNGFSRRLLTSALIPRKQITAPVNMIKLIGVQEGKILFQEESPDEILSSNLSLDSLHAIRLHLTAENKPGTIVRMFIQDHHLYLACGNMAAIIVYDLQSGSTFKHVLPDYFNQEAMFLTDRFILRAKDRALQSHRFIKLNLNKKDSITEDNFSDRKLIGGFETAGMLYYDTTTRQACYTYFYQNGFICMDSNLNLTLKARTIDTISHRNIKVARVGSSLTMNQPPPSINYDGCVADGKLFLRSRLKADNEHELDFKENSIIDVYSLKNGGYKGSFYIPAYEEKKAHQFQVINHQLYALYGKTVVLYDLEFIPGL